MFVFNPLALAPLFAAVLSLALALFSFRINNGVGKVRCTILFTSLFFYTAGAAAELCSTDLTAALLFVKLEYIGIALAAPCWLSLILSFAGLDKSLNHILLKSIFIIPGLTIVIAVSSLMIPWLYESAHMSVNGNFSLLTIVPGPWYWVNSGYNILTLTIGTIILAFMYIRSGVLYRHQISLMLIGSLTPFIALILNISGLRPIPDLDLTPFALIITGLSIIPAISRYHFMDILPIAHTTVLKKIPIGIIVLDAEERIRDINPAAERIVSVTPGEGMGKKAGLIIQEWDPMIQGLSDPSRQNEFQVFHDGVHEVFQVSRIPLEESASSPPGSIILFSSITTRIRAEEQERKRTAQLMTLLDTLPGFAYYKDTKGRYVNANRTFYDFFRINKPIEGLKDEDVLQLDFIQKTQSLDESILEGLNDEAEYETLITTADGEKAISGRIVPYRDEKGEITGLIGLGYDITTRKAEEARLKEYSEIIEMRNAELIRLHEELGKVNSFLDSEIHERTREVEALLIQKDQFINQLGHDLRTPLIPLVGLIPFLIEQEKDPDIIRLLSQMKVSIDVMQNTVEQIIHLAHLNSMYSITDRVSYDLANLVQTVIDEMNAEAKQAEISIFCDIPSGITVSLSPVHASAIIRHVISNAIRYNITGGSIWINVKTDIRRNPEKKPNENFEVPSELKQNTITLVIRDNGIGIAQDDLPRIFDEFFRADQSRQNLHAKGLGLAIVKRMVTINHGKIWAESEGPGNGSTFFIRFIRS